MHDHNKAPLKHAPSMTFAEATSAEPKALPGEHVAAAGVALKIKLRLNGVEVGYVGRSRTGWAVLTDSANAVRFTWYPWQGKTYLKVATNDYLSVGVNWPNKDYIGYYGWQGAGAFRYEGGYLISDVNGQKMSLYSLEDGYIYSNDGYSVLTAEFVA